MSDSESTVGLEYAGVAKKARNAKVTFSQKTLYLDFCQSNNKFTCGRLEGSYTKLKLDDDWKTLAFILNEAGPPKKTFTEWRGVCKIHLCWLLLPAFFNKITILQCFSDWRQVLKKKAQVIKNHTQGTGGGPPLTGKKGTLSELEERYFTIFGTIMVTGDEAVSELGFGQKEQKVCYYTFVVFS